MLKKVPKSKNFDLSLYEFLKKYSLKIEDHRKLLKYCSKKKLNICVLLFLLKLQKN